MKRKLECTNRYIFFLAATVVVLLLLRKYETMTSVPSTTAPLLVLHQLCNCITLCVFVLLDFLVAAP